MRPTAACIALALLLAAPGQASVQLHVSSATVARPGDDAEVCVALATDGEEVAGTQNDLVWDGTCATLPDAASCYAAGTHAKQLQGKLLDSRDFTYRGLILSLSDVDPIADGILYCCAFTVEAAPGTCCPLDVTGAGVSDSTGNAIPVLADESARLCTGDSTTPIVDPTPAPTPTPAIFAVVADHDGCAVVAPTHAGSALPLLLPALALLRRRRLPSPAGSYHVLREVEDAEGERRD